ncbi:hypothetical protein BH09PAT2_BH09PAT2_00870 [soil metagenome]
MSPLKESIYSTPFANSTVNRNDENYHQEELYRVNDAPLVWKRTNQQISVKDNNEYKKDAELRQSIFESYDPFNEAERLQKLSHLSPELQQYYISENLLSYFEEFAAEIRIKKLSGVIKIDGAIEMLGTNVTEMYKHSAQLAGQGSREDKEGRGLDMIASGILAGNNRALWVSPPKVADYGFVFTIVADDYDEQLGGRPFRELLLRYDEPIDSINESKGIYQTLKEKSGNDSPHSSTFSSADDFLEHPLLYSHNTYEDLNDLYELLHISDQDAEKSEVFRKELRPYIEPMMAEYTNIVRHMSAYDLSTKTEQLQMLEDQCKVLIGGMFNTARIINRKQDGSLVKAEQHEEDNILLDQLNNEYTTRDMLYIYAQQLSQREDLTIVGGSNCAVTRSFGSSENAFLEAVSMGIPITSVAQMIGAEGIKDKKECVTCPHCKNEKGNIKLKNKYVCGNKNCKSNK